MQQQMVTLDYAKRKQLYDRAQQLIVKICLHFFGTPNILAGANARSEISIRRARSIHIGNADELYVRSPPQENGSSMTERNRKAEGTVHRFLADSFVR